MSIASILTVTAIPGLRIASESTKVALSAATDFASYLSESTNRSSSKPETVRADDRTGPELDQLLPQLQHFLASIPGAENASIELRTDGQGSIEIDADPALKQAIEEWLNENSDWTEAWKTAARRYLATTEPSSFPGLPSTSLLQSSTVLRTTVS